MVYFRELVTDPTYASELLPLLVAEHASSSHDDNGLAFHLRGADETLLSRARATLEQVRAHVPVHGSGPLRRGGRAGT